MWRAVSGNWSRALPRVASLLPPPAVTQTCIGAREVLHPPKASRFISSAAPPRRRPSAASRVPALTSAVQEVETLVNTGKHGNALAVAVCRLSHALRLTLQAAAGEVKRRPARCRSQAHLSLALEQLAELCSFHLAPPPLLDATMAPAWAWLCTSRTADAAGVLSQGQAGAQLVACVPGVLQATGQALGAADSPWQRPVRLGRHVALRSEAVRLQAAHGAAQLLAHWTGVPLAPGAGVPSSHLPMWPGHASPSDGTHTARELAGAVLAGNDESGAALRRVLRRLPQHWGALERSLARQADRRPSPRDPGGVPFPMWAACEAHGGIVPALIGAAGPRVPTRILTRSARSRTPGAVHRLLPDGSTPRLPGSGVEVYSRCRTAHLAVLAQAALTAAALSPSPHAKRTRSSSAAHAEVCAAALGGCLDALQGHSSLGQHTQAAAMATLFVPHAQWGWAAAMPRLSSPHLAFVQQWAQAIQRQPLLAHLHNTLASSPAPPRMLSRLEAHAAGLLRTRTEGTWHATLQACRQAWWGPLAASASTVRVPDWVQGETEVGPEHSEAAAVIADLSALAAVPDSLPADAAALVLQRRRQAPEVHRAHDGGLLALPQHALGALVDPWAGFIRRERDVALAQAVLDTLPAGLDREVSLS